MTIRRIYVAILGLIGSIALLLIFTMISKWASWSFQIDAALTDSEVWAHLAEIVTAFSVAYAAAAYYRQKRVDQSKAVAEEVKMFRVEVMPLYAAANTLIDHITSLTGKTLEPIRNIEEFSLGWALSKRTKVALGHQAFWTLAMEEKSLEMTQKNWKDIPNKLLNAVEELSSHINAAETQDHEDLRSVINGVIDVVEIYFWPLLFNGPYDPNMYPAIKKLYPQWAPRRDRMSKEEVNNRAGEEIAAAGEEMLQQVGQKEYTEMFKKNPNNKPPKKSDIS